MGRMSSDISIALYSSNVMKLFCMFVEDVGRGMKECLITLMFYLTLVCTKNTCSCMFWKYRYFVFFFGLSKRK
jgi:hypothetical protein